jgi:hypothetical protein
VGFFIDFLPAESKYKERIMTTTLKSSNTLNGFDIALSEAFRKKEAIQDIIFRASNRKVDDFPMLLKATGNVDRAGHLDRWTRRNFGPRDRGYDEFDQYFLFPLLVIAQISYKEMIRMLPLGSSYQATLRELLAFQIENRAIVNKKLQRYHCRIIALGVDDFDVSGDSVPYIVYHSARVLDRIQSKIDETYGPKDLVLMRYPCRLSVN